MAESAPAAEAKRPRRPRRTRFGSRRAQGGISLAELGDKNGKADKENVRGTESGVTGSTAGNLALQSVDSEQRVDDLELTESSTGISKLFGEKLTPSVEYLQRTGSFILTSPGRLTFTAVFLIVAILAAGLSMSATTDTRQQQLANMSQASEPMAHASQNLYAALTIADASANTAFSRGNLDEGSDLRTRYDNAIAQASLAATRAAAGVDNVQSSEMKHIVEVQRLLPVYVGLVESARANARQTHPVGVSYLASASGLMTSQILPAASKLYEETSRSTNHDREVLTAPPLVPLSGILAAIVFLLLVQWNLTRRTGRLINAGLLAATTLMVIAFVAVSVSTVTTWQNERLYGNKTSPVQPLVEARIMSQKIRASETLDLVRRQPTDQKQFTKDTDEVERLLNSANDGVNDANIELALRSLNGWEKSHTKMIALLDEGDYAGAVRIATDHDADNTRESFAEPSSGQEFMRLDRALQAAISDARTELRNDIEEARVVSAALSGLTVALTVLASICVVVGFRNRLLEYL